MSISNTFSIVWQPYDSTSPTGRQLEKPVGFPFFLEGENHSALQAGRPARLDGRGLMLGILVSYEDPTPFIEAASSAQLAATAADLITTLGFPTLEVGLLDGAAYLRERHGFHVGRVALRTASKLSPSSAMIRSDLITTCWSLLRDSSEATRDALLREILDVYRDTDLSIIDAGVLEQVVFAHLVALCIVPGQQSAKDEFVRSSSILKIRGSWYIPRVQYLLSDPLPQLAEVL